MNRFMTVGSLFSGIGGFDLGCERAGMRVKWQVENNEFCNRVLAKHWPHVTRYGDIKEVNWQEVEAVDLVCGGFPCQPFSLAGKRRGQDDDRYLWPEVVRCLTALRPTWFLGENVPGIINLALDQVCTDLESLGYTVWPVCVPACAVDAPHQRQRVWIVAYTEGKRLQRGAQTRNKKQQETLGFLSAGSGESPRDVANPISDDNRRTNGVRGRKRQQKETQGAWPRENGDWCPEPDVGRVAHGVPGRVDRLRGLGNAVVPQVVEVLGRMILATRTDEHESNP